ncbi:MAG: response regulator transcription factor [Acidimicrobiales bacterium]|nr:response regulator transcription factor [Acidimicrobiales bacterium]
MIKILVIDDDRSLVRALQLGLASKHYVVDVAITGSEGLEKAFEGKPDLVIVDLGLPDIDGLEVCEAIRGWSDIPIIVLSASDIENRKVAAFDLGADDYVTKPFGMQELEARIRNALRHKAQLSNDIKGNTLWHNLEIDFIHKQVIISGSQLELTNKEFELLVFLIKHAGKTCTHQMILQNVWGDGYSNEAEYLRVYIYRLRKKLGEFGNISIDSIPGIGYSISSR